MKWTPVKNRKLNIIVIANVDFPNGTGGDTSRVRRICHSLANRGHDVFLLIPVSPWNVPPTLNKDAKGVIDGITFERICEGKPPRNSLIRFALFRLYSVFKTILRIIEINKSKSVDVLLLYNLALDDGLPLILLGKMKHFATVLEYCDLRPWSFEKSSRYSGFNRKVIILITSIADKLIPKYADSILVISKFLFNRVGQITNRNKLTIIPPIVDVETFSLQKGGKFFNEYKQKGYKIITYCGCYAENEGVKYLIEAYALLIKKHAKIKLVLVGGTPKNLYDECILLAKKFNVLNDMILMGIQPSDVIPMILASSNVLVAPKTKSKLNIAGVPTKFPEYLASGTPCIISKVGDLADYGSDMENVIFCEPENSVDLADKISFVLDNPDIANNIANRGKELAKEKFDVNAVGMLIEQAIQCSITKRR